LELIGGVSGNSRDSWLSVSVSPTAVSAYKTNPPLSVNLAWRTTPLSSSASSSRSTSGEHQRWKSRPPERISVVSFTCSGEDGRLRFWGVSVLARLLAGEPVAVPLHGILFLHCIERDDYNSKAPPWLFLVRAALPQGIISFTLF